MVRDIEVARYFVGKDTDNALFNKELTDMGGRSVYKGNARLNMLLHLAQNIYYAKTGHKLMYDSPHDDGAISQRAQEQYEALLNGAPYDVSFDTETTDYLNRFYIAFQNADINELIELYREGKELVDSHTGLDGYRKRYADIIRVMERMDV